MKELLQQYLDKLNFEDRLNQAQSKLEAGDLPTPFADTLRGMAPRAPENRRRLGAQVNEDGRTVLL